MSTSGHSLLSYLVSDMNCTVLTKHRTTLLTNSTDPQIHRIHHNKKLKIK